MISIDDTTMICTDIDPYILEYKVNEYTGYMNACMHLFTNMHEYLPS